MTVIADRATGVTGTTGRSRQRQPVGERITVALIPKAAEELERLQAYTGLSKTDLVNRAISLYKFIEAETRAGRDLIVRDNETGETQLIRLL